MIVEDCDVCPFGDRGPVGDAQRDVLVVIQDCDLTYLPRLRWNRPQNSRVRALRVREFSRSRWPQAHRLGRSAHGSQRVPETEITNRAQQPQDPKYAEYGGLTDPKT